MDKKNVEELMIPIDEFLTVSVDDSFTEAVKGLEKARDEYKAGIRKARVLLVVDSHNAVVGKLSPIDLLRGMEPHYDTLLNTKKSSHISKFSYLINSLTEELEHSSGPWDRLCETAKTTKVKDIVRNPPQSQVIQATENMNEAIHRFILAGHDTLFVNNGLKLVGLLSFGVVFHAILDKINTECGCER